MGKALGVDVCVFVSEGGKGAGEDESGHLSLSLPRSSLQGLAPEEAY